MKNQILKNNKKHGQHQLPKKRIQCKTCREDFKNSKKLNKHLCRGSGSFLCDICKRSFTHFKRLIRHINLHFNQRCNKQQYMCDVCKKIFWKLPTLQIHILSEHHNIRYYCEKCLKKFPSQENLDVHKCKEMPLFSCHECNRTFTRKNVFKKHVMSHGNTPLKCEFCYNTYMKESTYNYHRNKYNCSKSARLKWLEIYPVNQCRICQQEFQNESYLISHFNLYHEGKPHKCVWCNIELSTIEELKEHIHYHNTLKYTCKICDKAYTSQEGYRKHRIKHEESRFKCNYCQTQFLSERRCISHVAKCKKNPETGYIEPVNENRVKQTRQLNWESKIIVKKIRSFDVSVENVKSDDREDCLNENDISNESSDRQGWFDDYYKTGEDDLTFNLEAAFDGIEQSNNVEIESAPVASPVESSHCSDDSEDGMEQALDSKPKECRICGAEYLLEYELLHHFIKVHPGILAHKCPHCDEEYPLFAQLKEHMKVHGIGLGVYNCGNCSKVFRSESRLKTHHTKCSGDVLGNVSNKSCRRCGKTYQTKCGYKRHKLACKQIKSKAKMKTVNGVVDGTDSENDNWNGFDDVPVPVDNSVGKLPPSPSPPSCCSPPPSPASSAHEAAVKSDINGDDALKKNAFGEPPKNSFPCRLCPATFQYERGIVMHFKSNHPQEKPLICHVCGLGLADKLREHLKTHGIGEEFVCELCGKRFNQKFVSKIHEMWHQGIEFKCEICKQKFLNKEKMEKHINEKRCRNRQSLMRLPCDICGKFYRSKFGLSNHYLTHTPRDLRPVKNRMNCEFCGKWFESNNGLQRHRRIHTGEKPFCCRYCPRAFAQEGNCKSHERTHTGESKPRKKKIPKAPVIQTEFPDREFIFGNT